MDRWTQGIVVLEGGLNTSTSPIQQGITSNGSARALINYECLVGGGYRRIDGYSAYSDTEVPGDTDTPVLGVHPFHEGVIATRLNSTSIDINYGTGTTWTTLNVSPRTGTTTKTRAVTYELDIPTIVIVDGNNHAFKYQSDGTAATINHASAPNDPSYVAYHLNRLVLSGYSSNPSAITLSVPNDDENYNAVDGAIELQVGDTVLGLKSFRNELYIIGKKSIHKLQGTSSSDFIVIPVATNIGIKDSDTLQEVGGDLIYLARDGFRTVAGTTRVGDVELGLVSRDITSEVQEMLSSAVVTYSTITIPDKSQYRLFYHRASDTNASAKGFIGTYKPTEFSTYSFSTTLGFPVYCAGSDVLTNGDTLQVFGHPSNGLVYVFDTSNSLGGNSLPYRYTSPPLTFPQDQVDPRKVLYKWGMTTKVEGATTFNMKITLDEFEVPARNQPYSEIITLGDLGTNWDEADWDEFTWALEEELKVIRINCKGSGKTFTLEVNGSSLSDDSHTIYSHILEYSVKGKR
jgi:hypothetical protein